MKKKILIICVLLVLAGSAAAYLGTRSYSGTFTAEKWARYPERREKMIESLTSSHTLVGMNTDDLHELLGSADKTQARTDLYSISSEDDIYFAVQYNQSGIVTRVYTLQSGADAALSAR